MKITLISLGCSKNLVDSEVMLGVVRRAKHDIVDGVCGADAAIVNTCAFIEEAKKESIDTIFALARLKQEGKLKKLIVAGCLAQRYKRKLSALLPEADAFIGTGNLRRINDALAAGKAGKRAWWAGEKHFLYDARTPRIALTPRHYAYVKIAEGCANRCSYCVIPGIRGAYRSRPAASVVEEARLLAARGVKEINLISQDTAFYGNDLYGRPALENLLRKLAGIGGLRWIRLLYIHPRHCRPGLLEMIGGEKKLCKYIDLPIQHINDNILRRMRRRISSGRIKRLIEDVRRRIPQAALRTSLIVGFPGETERIFKELFDFAAGVRFERLGVFRYSREEGTAAARLPAQVPRRLKTQRFRKIMMLQKKIVRENNRLMTGKNLDVLVDEILPAGGGAAGRTQFDAPEVDGSVFVRGGRLTAGSLVSVKITGSHEYDLIGEAG